MILALGIAGKCSGVELINLTTADSMVYESKAFLTIRNESEKSKYKIIGSALTIVKRYMIARKHVNHPKLVLLQHNDHFLNQSISLAVVDNACREAARFLALPNFTQYNYKCFRQTAENFAAEEDVDEVKMYYHYR
ncbi:hypothetical protein QAD02_002639 [Eretmocerus hayati]|uniref:Uncharacterized protein n=1 Tax=Eretmocerus hayati TaxID=131215 RepID=A0ACC2NJI0_9HYME|nr:hypothetical protein QAD02_002639 [Eretmocerus hayati]